MAKGSSPFANSAEYSAVKFQLLLPVILLASCDISEAALSWERTIVQREAEPNTPKIEAVYAFSNTTAHQITVKEITTSCGCVVAELEKRVFSPGEHGVIKAVFTPGSRVGFQFRTISVLTDDEAAPALLDMRVNIQEFIQVEPRSLVWTPQDAQREKIITCKAEGPKSFDILSTDALQAGFSTRIESIVPKREYRIVVQPRSGLMGQAAFIPIKILSSAGLERQIDVEASVSAQPRN